MTDKNNEITIQEILSARKQIQAFIRKTPLEFNEGLSKKYQSNIYLKLENLQTTGSFKIRGAFNKLKWIEKQSFAGVIAPSAGNHGIGLAYAAKQLDIEAHIYLPENTDKGKIRQLKNLNAKLKFFDDIELARLQAIKDAQMNHYCFVSAYNDQQMISANGTIALEILEELPNLDSIIIPIGGGGLSSGVSTVLKTINPEINVIGVQTENSPTFAKWYQENKISEVVLKSSIAEGLSGPIEQTTITFPIIQKNVNRIVTVSETEIKLAMKELLNYQYIVEPSGAVGIAALKKCQSEIIGKNTAILITGQNISWDRLIEYVK